MAMKRWKIMDYIYLNWDGRPEFHAIAGHVAYDDYISAVKREIEIDLSGKKIFYEWAHISGISGLQLFTKQKKGRIPVTVCYI